jgi:GxxExxY protein
MTGISHRLTQTSTDRTLLSDGRFPHAALTKEIIGAAFEVHRVLGYGFLEKVYEAALTRELRGRGHRVINQAEMEVSYKGEPVGLYYADLLVDDAVICEVKVLDKLAPAHEAQLLNYLKATSTKVGLLLNFGPQGVQVKRMVF